MKKRSLFLIIVLAFSISFLNAIVESTAEGGSWNDPATWVGGVVPGETDEVVIHSTVILNCNATVAALQVLTSAILQPDVGASRLLYVSGNVYVIGQLVSYGTGNIQAFVTGSVTNEGWISVSHMEIGGDLLSSGGYGSNWYTTFTGPVTHHLAQYFDDPFFSHVMIADASGTLIIDGPFSFGGYDLNLGGANCTFMGDLSNVFISNGTMTAGTNGIGLTNTFVENVSLNIADYSPSYMGLSGVSINGLTVNIPNGRLVFRGSNTIQGSCTLNTGTAGDVYLEGSIYNDLGYERTLTINGQLLIIPAGALSSQSNGWLQVILSGRLNNQGTVSLHHAEIGGDIINSGSFVIDSGTYMTSMENRGISNVNGGIFTSDVLYTGGTGTLDLGGTYDLGGHVINLNGTSGSAVNLSVSNGSISNGELIANASGDGISVSNCTLSSLTLRDPGRSMVIQSCSLANVGLEANAMLDGENWLNGGDVHITGNATITGSIRNDYGYGRNLHIDGNLLNDGGQIASYDWGWLQLFVTGSLQNGGSLNVEHFEVGGDLISAGAITVANSLYFTGAVEHCYSVPGVFNGSILMSDPSGSMVFDSDLVMNGNNFDMNGANGTFLGSAIISARVTNGTLYVPGEGVALENAMAGNISIVGNTTWRGDNFIDGGELSISGDVVVEGALRNAYGQGRTLNINGNLQILGSICNYDWGWTQLYLSGNLINNGSLTVVNTYLTGTDDQHLRTDTNSAFSTPMYCTNSTGYLVLDSACSFANNNFDLAGSILNLQGYQLSSVNVYGGTINFNVPTSRQTARTETAFALRDLTVSNATVNGDGNLEGTVTVGDGSVIFTGNITVNGTLTMPYGTGYWATFLQNLAVVGAVVGPDWGWIGLNIGGDLNDQGNYAVTATNLNGAGNQTIGNSTGNHVNGSFTVTKSSGSVMLDNIDFNGNPLYLNDTVAYVLGDEIRNLNVVGGAISEMPAPFTHPYVIDGASLSAVTVAGTVEWRTQTNIVGDNVVWNGNHRNTGLLINDYGTTRIMAVVGDFTNDGTIRPSDWGALYMTVHGDVTNNGTMSLSALYLGGSGPRTVHLSGGFTGFLDVTGPEVQFIGNNVMPEFTIENWSTASVERLASLTVISIDGLINGVLNNHGSVTLIRSTESGVTRDFFNASASSGEAFAGETENLAIETVSGTVPPTLPEAASDWWRLTPFPASSATLSMLALHYSEENIPVGSEQNLQVFRSDDGNHWTCFFGAAIDTETNTVTLYNAPGSGYYGLSPVLKNWSSSALLTPADNDVNQPVRPMFTWNPLGLACRYEIQIGDDPTVANCHAQAESLTTTSWRCPTALDPIFTYFWRIRAITEQFGSSDWSTSRAFIVRDYLTLNLPERFVMLWNGESTIDLGDYLNDVPGDIITLSNLPMANLTAGYNLFDLHLTPTSDWAGLENLVITAEDGLRTVSDTVAVYVVGPIRNLLLTRQAEGMKLSWAEQLGADQYRVYASITPYGGWTLLSEPTANSWIDTSGTTPRYYRVTSVLSEERRVEPVSGEAAALK
jgi:hypothetical protein